MAPADVPPTDAPADATPVESQPTDASESASAPAVAGGAAPANENVASAPGQGVPAPAAAPQGAPAMPGQGQPAPAVNQPPAGPDMGASASLYVGDLHPDITEGNLSEIFQALGPLSSIRVCRDQVTRRSLGYAYVNFHNMQDAMNALDTMNCHASPLTKGRPMRIMWKHRDPSARKQGQGNIYVKGLDKSIDNKCLFDTFSQFGKIMSCKVATDESNGQSLGYGFVHFETPEVAKTATESVNGMMLAGRQVFVMPFLNKREREAAGQVNTSFTNVYVKNIDESICTDEKIRELFAKYGAITSLHVPTSDTGKPKGFAFINFESADLARQAVDEMNGKEMEEKALFVGRAQKKSERETELRNKYEAMKMERMQKLQGVNLYVKNLGDDMDDEKLRQEFADFGTITSCKIMRDDKGQSRGFGFVCFTQPEEATKAVTGLNGRMIGKKPIYVALAQRKETRRANLELQRNIGQIRMPGAAMPGPAGGMYGQPPYVFQQAPGMPPQINPAMAGRGNPGFMNPQYMAMGRGGPVGRGGPINPAYMMGRGQPVNPAAMSAAAMAQYGMVQQRQPRQPRQRNGPVGGGGPGGPGVGGVGRGGGGGGPGGGPNQQFKYTQNTRNANSGTNGGAPANGAGQAQQGNSGQQAGRGQGTDTDGSSPLTVEQLSAANPTQQKQLLGEKLFPLIAAKESTLAGKITGMLLEMENTDILHLIDTPEALDEQVQEALTVLMAHKQQADGGENGAAGAGGDKGTGDQPNQAQAV